MSHEYVFQRIARQAGIREDQAHKSIEAASKGIHTLMAKGPPPPSPPAPPPKGVVKEIAREAGISEKAAGVALAIIIAEITHIGLANGIFSVLEYRDFT